MANFIGIDAGGTKIGAIYFANGKLKRNIRVPTPKSRALFLKALVSAIETAAAGEGFSGIGLACAGAINQKNKIILNSPNLQFLNGLKLGAILQKRFKKPVALENDAHCFLLGETAFGAAKGKKNVVALTLGTGVGGAVLIDGKLLRGSHGAAGELGHTFLSEKNNNPLSIEDLISSHGFARFGIKNVALLREGVRNKRDKQIMKKVGHYLGLALAGLINIFDPEMVVLSGGLLRGVEKEWLAAATKEIKKYTMIPNSMLPPIRISRLPAANAMGAITLLQK